MNALSQSIHQRLVRQDMDTLATECQSESSAWRADKTSKAGQKAATSKSVLAGLEELWDESQYAEEFSLQGFTSKLSTKP